jgi:hypothetical protein
LKSRELEIQISLLQEYLDYLKSWILSKIEFIGRRKDIGRADKSEILANLALEVRSNTQPEILPVQKPILKELGFPSGFKWI